MDNVIISRSRSHFDERGSLYFAEYPAELPFVVKRVYYICNVKSSDIVRGLHAHKKLEQVLICLGGQCEIVVDNGKDREVITLDSPDTMLIIKPCIWREIRNMSKNATLMVLASAEYNEEDYIRNYDEFLSFIGVK